MTRLCLSSLLFCCILFCIDSVPTTLPLSLLRITQKNDTLCPTHIENQIDKLTLRLFTFGKSGRSFPEHFSDFEYYCSETRFLKKQFQNFIGNCVKDSFTKNILKIVLHTIEKESRYLCKTQDTPTKRQHRLIESAPCSNSVKNLHQKCIIRTIKHVVDSINMKDNRKKLGHICCNIQQMDNCMHDAMLDNKSRHCNRKRADVAMEFLSVVGSNAFNFLCGDFNSESNQCDSFIAEPSKSGTFGYNFFIMPLIKSLANVEITFF